MPDLPSPGMLERAVAATRKHLGMDAVYISEFEEEENVLRLVDAPELEQMIRAGDHCPLSQSLYRHILSGRLPELMPDLSQFPLALRTRDGAALPPGALISVPIRGVCGTPFGMFSCLSRRPDPTLSQRDLGFLHILADVVGRQVADKSRADRMRSDRFDTVQNALEKRAFCCVYQPIWDLSRSKAAGLEALVRFSPCPYRPPNEWFADADAAGLGIELELGVMETAIEAFASLPPELYLSLNASPALVLSGLLPAMLRDLPPERLLLEITEHAIVDNYTELAEALAPLRQSGIRIAIDDAGAGYSTLQHILQLAPERIKLDMSLTRSVNADPARRALVTAMVLFARETGATLIAEGIETRAEFETLIALGVRKGQGYFLGRPADLASTLDLIKAPPGPAC